MSKESLKSLMYRMEMKGNPIFQTTKTLFLLSFSSFEFYIIILFLPNYIYFYQTKTFLINHAIFRNQNNLTEWNLKIRAVARLRLISYQLVLSLGNLVGDFTVEISWSFKDEPRVTFSNALCLFKNVKLREKTLEFFAPPYHAFIS